MSKKKQKPVAPAKNTRLTADARSKTVSSSYTGINSMMNWLAGLLLILSFLYTETLLDAAVAIRYIFLSGFILVFIVYFFAIRKRAVTVHPFLVKLVFICGGLFALWMLLGLAGAINYHEGYYEISRHLLHLVLLLIIMTSVMHEPVKLITVCNVLTVVALLHGIVGIFQFYEIAFTGLPGNFKPYGFMTNRNLFGSAQALLLPFALYTFYAGSRSWKITAGISVIVIIISLLFSQTRSAWLSGIAILVIAAILVIVFVPALRKKWSLFTLIVVGVTAAIVSILILTDKESSFAKTVTERAASLVVTSSPGSEADLTISERLKMWKKTMSMIGDHPLTGVGAGNWKVVVPSYGLDSTVFAKGFYAPDRVHNTYLQMAAETGIPGAVFYFAMWLIIAFTGFKLIRKTNNENKKILAILMLAGLAAVAVDTLFSFAIERIEHSVYMLLMGGIILGLYLDETPTASKNSSPNNAFVIALLIVAAFNLFLGKKKFDFENYLKQAIFYNEQKRFSETITAVNQGRNTFFTIDITGNPLELYSAVAYKELKNYDASTKDFAIAKSYSPYNARTYNNRATLYWDLKQLQNSIDDYKTALLYAPEFETVLKNLAITYYQAGQWAACIETIGKMKEKDELVINVLNDARKKLSETK